MDDQKFGITYHMIWYVIPNFWSVIKLKNKLEHKLKE